MAWGSLKQKDLICAECGEKSPRRTRTQKLCHKFSCRDDWNNRRSRERVAEKKKRALIEEGS